MLDSLRCFALKHLALLALQTANILETVQGLSSFVFFCQISSSTIRYKSIMYNTDVRNHARDYHADLIEPSWTTLWVVHAWRANSNRLLRCMRSCGKNARGHFSWTLPIPWCSFLVSIGLCQEDLGSHTLPLSTCRAWFWAGQFDSSCSTIWEPWPCCHVDETPRLQRAPQCIESWLNSVEPCSLATLQTCFLLSATKV